MEIGLNVNATSIITSSKKLVVSVFPFRDPPHFSGS